MAYGLKEGKIIDDRKEIDKFFVHTNWKGLILVAEAGIDNLGNSKQAIKRDSVGRILLFDKEGRLKARFPNIFY